MSIAELWKVYRAAEASACAMTARGGEPKDTDAPRDLAVNVLRWACASRRKPFREESVSRPTATPTITASPSRKPPRSGRDRREHSIEPTM
jgi:hypothetical protein